MLYEIEHNITNDLTTFREAVANISLLDWDEYTEYISVLEGRNPYKAETIFLNPQNAEAVQINTLGSTTRLYGLSNNKSAEKSRLYKK